MAPSAGGVWAPPCFCLRAGESLSHLPSLSVNSEPRGGSVVLDTRLCPVLFPSANVERVVSFKKLFFVSVLLWTQNLNKKLSCLMRRPAGPLWAGEAKGETGGEGEEEVHPPRQPFPGSSLR